MMMMMMLNCRLAHSEECGHPLHGIIGKFSGAVRLFQPKEAHEMMRCEGAFHVSGRGGSYGYLLVELPAVGRQDFRFQKLGKGNGQTGLAHGRGPHNGYEQRTFTALM